VDDIFAVCERIKKEGGKLDIDRTRLLLQLPGLMLTDPTHPRGADQIEPQIAALEGDPRKVRRTSCR
jgi:hypothetical protein